MGYSIETIHEMIGREGWVTFPNAIELELVEELIKDLEDAYQICRNIQIENGVEENTDGTVHHLICLGGSFLKFLEVCPLWGVLETYFDGKFILNSFGGVKNIKDKLSYVGNIHRDIRTYSSDVNLMINMLVMLDDFTEENGATYFLSESHKTAQKPDDDDFFKKAKRATGRKGTIVLFNSNLWHAAGTNRTDKERRALTLTFTKPFMKQQLDYTRALGITNDIEIAEILKQVLGFYSRVPSNLYEWYQPRQNRFYRSDQG